MRRWSSIVACIVAAAALSACGPSEPKPKAGEGQTEEQANYALERAKKKGDPDELVEVFQKYGQFAAGKSALRIAARKYFEKALEAAEACNEEGVKKNLAKIAPYTSDDPQIDEAYNETKDATGKERKRCELVHVDEQVKKLEAKWDYVAAFKAISEAKEADGGALKTRRVELTDRWKGFVDDTLRKIIAKRSIKEVLGDKREAFENALDPEALPAEVTADAAKRKKAFEGCELLFETMEDGWVIDPPSKWWTFGQAKPRKPEAPKTETGVVMANGIPFHVVGKGKIGTTAMLAAGPAEGDLWTRIGSIKLLVPEGDARPFDTNFSLPDVLIDQRVLAPISPGSDTLRPVLVVGEGAFIKVRPIGTTGPKYDVKKKELRGWALMPGQKVTVIVGGAQKPGEIADKAQDERILVRISGFETFVPLADVRVKRADLPALPE